MIFLVGMPGSGKSYWAEKIAEEYKIKLVDIDALIEEREGMPIRQIFEEKDEEYFRQLEHDMLLSVIKQYKGKDVVVAGGGGLPIHYNNMQLMLEHGCTVYLKVSIDTINTRLYGMQIKARPMMNLYKNITDALTMLLDQRKDVYEQAIYTVDCDNATISSFKEIIDSCTDKQ